MGMQRLPLPLMHSGKVRDTYRLPDRPTLLLVVASDRLSTHNVVHSSTIPGKGELLTAQSVFMMTKVIRSAPTHLVASGPAVMGYLPGTSSKRKFPADLWKTAVVVRRLALHRREFIWRNYLTGTLYKALQKGTDPYGIGLPQGMPLMSRFLPAIFTPTEKSGVDDPVLTSETMLEFPHAYHLTQQAFLELSLFTRNLSPSVITIDSKFEANEAMIGDEIGTGDSSRFTLASDVETGKEPITMDKEIARKTAERIWNGGAKSPIVFPESVIAETERAYHRLFEIVTGKSLVDFQKDGLEFDRAA